MSMREPFLELRSKEEKPVEKILFVYNPDRPSSRTAHIPLLSCHADGCIRIWDVFDGVMMNEFNCQVMDDEGLTTMSCDNECTMLMVGGSKGHVRLIDLRAMLVDMHDRQSGLDVLYLWRAHMLSVSSVSYVKQYDILLTSSKDATVRIWTMEGSHIGTFGDRPWVFGDESTYCLLPPDLKQDLDLETKKADMANKKEALIKKNVIDTWRGDTESADQDESKDKQKKNLDRLRAKALLAHVTKKWKEYWSLRKNVDDWTLNPELITVKNAKQFFSFDIQQRHRPPKPTINVKYDSFAKFQLMFAEAVRTTLHALDVARSLFQSRTSQFLQRQLDEYSASRERLGDLDYSIVLKMLRSKRDGAARQIVSHFLDGPSEEMQANLDPDIAAAMSQVETKHLMNVFSDDALLNQEYQTFLAEQLLDIVNFEVSEQFRDYFGHQVLFQKK
eukprot:jgi/Hompol1/2089/HPOL_005462-RA